MIKWRDKDIADLKDRWGNASYSMHDLCLLFSSTPIALRHVAKINGLPAREQMIKDMTTHRSKELKKIVNSKKHSKGDHDPKEVAARMRKLHKRNTANRGKSKPNNRKTWRSENRSCYKRSVCQWPETWDENHIKLCGASVSGDKAYCQFHTNLSTNKGLTEVGLADMDYLDEWWKQTY